MPESNFSPPVPDGRYDITIGDLDYENVAVRDGVAYLITHYPDGTFSCFMPYADPTSMTLTRVDLSARIAKARRDGEPVVYGRVDL